MLIGREIWYTATKGDIGFDFIIDEELDTLLKFWDKYHFVDNQLLELLNGIFKYEADRITMDGIKKHLWSKSTLK